MNGSLKTTLAALFLTALASAAEAPAKTSLPGPATPAAAGAFTLERLVGLIPVDTKLRKAGRWDAVGTVVATQAMRAKALQQPAELKVKVAQIEPHPFNGHAIVVHSKPAPVVVNGTSIPCEVFVYFDADSLDGVGAVRNGDTITVSGVINKADIEIKGESATLIYELLRAQLKQPAAKR